MDVQDKSTETGVKINNILTALVLMVMSWVGYNIDKLKDDVSQWASIVSVNENKLDNLKEKVQGLDSRITIIERKHE
jgi:hypothetical protein